MIATPIGNLGDITVRAIETLRRVDGIVCEDSRVTRKLLSKYGIGGRLLTYHEHNAKAARPRLLRRLKEGETLALVSDAGTPLISDPGFKLVRASIEANIELTFLPGPSAPIAALVLSGLPPDRFFFGGFLPTKAAAKQRDIARLALLPATLVFFESTKRLANTLRACANNLGVREAAVVREATKLHEEVRRGRLADLAKSYDAMDSPKGEVVLVIGPPLEAETDIPDTECLRLLSRLLENKSLRDATNEVVALTGRNRREIYALAIKVANKEKD